MAKTKKNYWFKAKNYGWGWYPSTWQGWLITLIYLATSVRLMARLDSVSYPAKDMLMNYFLPLVFFTLSFIFLAYQTGEPPRWRWGSGTREGSRKQTKKSA